MGNGDVSLLAALLQNPGNHLQLLFAWIPFTFERAPGSAPGTGGPHFWTWTCLFHQEPDHSFDLQLLHELDLDLGGSEPRDLCSSDVEGEPHQADHQRDSSETVVSS